MDYFKDANGELYAYDKNMDKEELANYIKKHKLVSITEEEFSTLTKPNIGNLKNIKIDELKAVYFEESTKSVFYKEVVYKGGESSASAIAGAVQLAQSLKEASATIIDIEDKENDLTFEEAMELSALIAKAWRAAFFKYKELKRAVLAAQSVEELELIKW